MREVPRFEVNNNGMNTMVQPGSQGVKAMCVQMQVACDAIRVCHGSGTGILSLPAYTRTRWGRVRVQAGYGYSAGGYGYPRVYPRPQSGMNDGPVGAFRAGRDQRLSYSSGSSPICLFSPSTRTTQGRCAQRSMRDAASCAQRLTGWPRTRGGTR